MNTETAAQLWNDASLLLYRDSNYNHSSMSALFSSLEPVAINDNELLLSTANRFTKDWVERRLSAAILEAIWSVSGQHYNFRIMVNDPSRDDAELDALDRNAPSAAQTAPLNQVLPIINQTVEIPPAALTSQLDQPVSESRIGPTLDGQWGLEDDLGSESGYNGQTFESFVLGDSNRQAFSMAVNVAKMPGDIMNPLFIYGKSGLGKTHLLLSIRHYLQQHRPELNVIYVQTKELVAEYSDSARQRDFSQFNQKYYAADVFLLDDVQFLETTNETANTVFDIFNLLILHNKQIVLSADRSPNEIHLHERFLSRFNSGVIADVQPPSRETKITIFSHYLDYCCRRWEREDVRSLIREEVVEHIVSLSGSNIRELEGAATNLVYTLVFDQKKRVLPISVEEAETIVAHHFRRLNTKAISIANIQKEVENYFNVRHVDILSAKRSQDISYPRQVAMYLCRHLTPASLPQLGEAFAKDHTAVLYAADNIEKKRQLSSRVDDDVRELIEIITG